MRGPDYCQTPSRLLLGVSIVSLLFCHLVVRIASGQLIALLMLPTLRLILLVAHLSSASGVAILRVLSLKVLDVVNEVLRDIATVVAAVLNLLSVVFVPRAAHYTPLLVSSASLHIAARFPGSDDYASTSGALYRNLRV
jgi:hypothetical protein